MGVEDPDTIDLHDPAPCAHCAPGVGAGSVTSAPEEPVGHGVTADALARERAASIMQTALEQIAGQASGTCCGEHPAVGIARAALALAGTDAGSVDAAQATGPVEGSGAGRCGPELQVLSTLVASALRAFPIAWLEAGPVPSPCAEHVYDGACAICRAVEPGALANVMAAAFSVLRQASACLGQEGAYWDGLAPVEGRLAAYRSLVIALFSMLQDVQEHGCAPGEPVPTGYLSQADAELLEQIIDS